jgi:bile acid:Na+ symporter, BASS family
MDKYVDPLSHFLILLFLISTMVSIGLRVTVPDLRLAMSDRGLLLRALLVNFVLVPALGALLVRVFPLSGNVSIALLLLAASAGGPNAIQFTSKVKGGLAQAAALLFILTLLAVPLAPVIAGLLLPAAGSLGVPMGRVVMGLVLYLLLPLVVGLAVHQAKPHLAELLAKPLTIIGALAFVVVVIHSTAVKKAAMAGLDRTELLALLALILGSMVLGWIFGGPVRETRRVLASTTGMRNAAIALLIALRSYPETDVDAAVVAGVALMIPINCLYTLSANIGSAIASRAHARAGGHVR